MARRKNPESEAPADMPDPVPMVADAPETAPESPVEPPPPPPPMPPSPPPVPEAPRRSGLLAPVLGGALAAIGGFGLSHFDAFGLTGADSSGEVAALAGRLDALETTLTAETSALPAVRDDLSGLQARLDALESAPAPEPPDLSALTTLDQRLSAIEAMPQDGDASTAALAAKLAELERRIQSLPQGGVDTAKVDEALARLATAEAEATARAEAAAEAAASAERSAALDALRRVAASGGPFEAELAAANDPALTAALGPHAAGVAPVAALQADFPDLARAALELSRAANADQGWGARLMAFLAAQTGARPLTPQDGNSPEAILSRADFAVTEGRLADALAEIGTLSADARAAFDTWRPKAEARIAVDSALEAK
jgi:hypothetical protein